MAHFTLDERSRDILKSLIHLYICTGEPVGSETLARALNRSLSPATIRNVMADLERAGYLEHPHTSAGRMPTDEGYRVYVDGLPGPDPLPARDAAMIRSELAPVGTPTQVMEHASQVLSRLSRHVGFVLAPDVARTVLRHLDLVRLTHPRVLVVLVSGGGIVNNRVIEIEEHLTQDELQECANYLNAHFAGRTLPAIRAQLIELMLEEKAAYDSLLAKAVAVGTRAFAAEGEASAVYLDGASHMLNQSNEVDIARLRALFQTFEEKSRLVRILNACLAGDGVRVLIGHENPEPDLVDVAVVGARVEGEPGFGVGVLGLTRMEYPRVLAVVDHVARAVSDAMKEMGS